MQLPQLPRRTTCNRCQLHATANNIGMPFAAHPLHATGTNCLVLLGDRPGNEDDRKGLPFSGPSGTILWGDPGSDYLSELGPPPDTAVYAGTLLRCWSPARTMPQATYTACTGWLLEDLNSLAAAHPGDLTLLALGAGPAMVLSHLIGGKRLGLKQSLSLQGCTYQRWSVFFTYNPAQLLPHAEPALVVPTLDHLSLVRDHMDGMLPATLKPNLVPPGPL